MSTQTSDREKIEQITKYSKWRMAPIKYAASAARAAGQKTGYSKWRLLHFNFAVPSVRTGLDSRSRGSIFAKYENWRSLGHRAEKQPTGLFFNTRDLQVPCSISRIEKGHFFECPFSMRETGLEPVRCEPHAPQTCASASSATLALRKIVYNRFIFLSIEFFKNKHFYWFILKIMLYLKMNQSMITAEVLWKK